MRYKPSKVYSAALMGLEAQIIEVEADVSVGLNSFQIVGLPDKTVEESKERISSALKNLGFKHPRAFNKRVVINLAPADVRKEGVIYDLPIALSFLLASMQIKTDPKRYLFAGELSLDGKLRPIRNSLSFALLAKDKNIEYLVVPKENHREARLVDGVKVLAVETLAELISLLEGSRDCNVYSEDESTISLDTNQLAPEVDMRNISGQNTAKRGLEIAAAGGHNVMMQGPPGSGKTILAHSFAGILPAMSKEEMIEVTRIQSMLGRVDIENPLVKNRPFRNPHHSSSATALIGGGSNLKPGEITLAHRGVLFLDEFPEFHRDVIEALRQPLESGFIQVARAKGQVLFPAKFILIAAANPCPCGFFNDPEKTCKCYGSELQRYRRKLSGPIRDRIDMQIEIPHQRYAVLTSGKPEVSSGEIRSKVENARVIQRKRFENSKSVCNGEMSIQEVKKYCQAPKDAEEILRKAVDKDRLSARGYHKILKLARTIADLYGESKIKPQHVAEAISYNNRVEHD